MLSNCYYCGCDDSELNPLTLDHVVPRSKGGSNKMSNKVPSCRSCNSSKGNKSLEEFRFLCAIKRTPLFEIINSAQALKLIDLGYELDIPEFEFFFEEVR